MHLSLSDISFPPIPYCFYSHINPYFPFLTWVSLLPLQNESSWNKIQIIQVPCSELITAYRMQFLLFLRSRYFMIPIHLFIQWIFIEYLPHSRHFSGHVGHISEQNLTNTLAVLELTACKETNFLSAMKKTQTRLFSNPEPLSQLSTLLDFYLYTINTSFLLNESLAIPWALQFLSFFFKDPILLSTSANSSFPMAILIKTYLIGPPLLQINKEEKEPLLVASYKLLHLNLKTTLLGRHYVYFTDNNSNNGKNKHFYLILYSITY